MGGRKVTGIAVLRACRRLGRRLLTRAAAGSPPVCVDPGPRRRYYGTRNQRFEANSIFNSDETFTNRDSQETPQGDYKMMAVVISRRQRNSLVIVRAIGLSLLVGSALLYAPAAEAALRHQYSFNTAVGTGGTFNDLVGGATGTLFGAATISGGNTGQLILPGAGAGESGDHARLAVTSVNLNTYTNVTFAMWTTWNGGGIWQRYFDIGGHSISAPANGGNTIWMSPDTGGAEPSGIRLAISNVDLNTQSGFNNEQNISTATPAPIGVQRHVVGVFNGTNDQMRIYVDGAQVAQNSVPVTHMLSLLQNDFFLLGGSLYGADPSFNASNNQFEIYDTALSAA